MIAAFFHDERFTRDASGVYHSSSGAIPYRALARFLRHLDRVIVVGRLFEGAGTGTVASGAGVEFACVDGARLSVAGYLRTVSRHAREVLSRADCGIVRLPSLIGVIASHEALRLAKPILAEVVGDPFDALWNHGSLKGRLAALPLALVNRHYISRAPFATYVTRASLQRRYPPGGDAVAVSDVIIDPPLPEILERRLAAIDARSPGAPATVGLVGSYDVAYKGHETALRALAALRRSGHAVTLRCIGVGDARRWRDRAASLGVERWVELGRPLRQGAPVLEWMDSLDVYLIPSLQEGLPRALVEAMSRGLPAIGSRRGGIPELIGPASVHRPGDARGLAALLRALLDRPEEMKAQARANWRTAGAYASTELDAKRDALLARFRSAVAGGGGPRDPEAFPASGG